MTNRDGPGLFYFGLNPRWQSYKWLPSNLNVMYSAAGQWREDHWDYRHFPKTANMTWLDFGGYLFFSRGHEDYPFSVEAALCLVARIKPDYYASLDYPCEPSISDSIDHVPVRERIHRTVQRAEEMAQWDTQVTGTMVPVIQGYHLDDYAYCMDLYQQAGLIRPYMAIGSICARSDDSEIVTLIRNLYHEARGRGIKRLHYFGLKVTEALETMNGYIWSRDSAVAMVYGQQAGLPNGRRYPRGQAEKRKVFFFFRDKKVIPLTSDYRLTTDEAVEVIFEGSGANGDYKDRQDMLIDLDCMADDGCLSYADLLHLTQEYLEPGLVQGMDSLNRRQK